MTKIVERKTRLQIESPIMIRERGRLREVIAEAKPFGLEVRLKGRRKTLPIGWDDIYLLACRREAERQVAERRAKRKEAQRG